MNIWLEVAKALLVAGIAALIFYVGTIAGDLKATVDFNETFSAMTMKLMRDRQEKIRLIALMKRAGRRKREECRNLKKQGDLIQSVNEGLAWGNEIMRRKNYAMRDALHEIAGECAKSRWQMKVFRRILKKHGVKINV